LRGTSKYTTAYFLTDLSPNAQFRLSKKGIDIAAIWHNYPVVQGVFCSEVWYTEKRGQEDSIFEKGSLQKLSVISVNAAR
jgi:hypothetical protein